MIKTLAPIVAALAVLITLVVVVACEEDDVGIPCEIGGAISGTDAGGGSSQINPQAMDCRSRLCLKFGSFQENGMCTTICDSDSDCPDDMETCPTGFRCLPAVETGALRCCKMCVCEKYASGSDAGTGLSATCAANPNKNCPDL
jgi:hypothetical protein